MKRETAMPVISDTTAKEPFRVRKEKIGDHLIFHPNQLNCALKSQKAYKREEEGKRCINQQQFQLQPN